MAAAIFRSVAEAIGVRRATEVSLTGRIFQLPEAIQWGLITEAVPAFELDDRSTAIATHLAESRHRRWKLACDF
ncbi:MAG: enoyl-CoA hydratase-related protein [Bryobacteraceae bacterium]